MSCRTVLVADDETHILNVLTIKLQNAGYTVLAAQDGEEAYRLACTNQPDLVITDYQMPRLSGIELCARLRCTPATRDIPAVLLTARGFSMCDRDIVENNIHKVIAKPFSPREVLALVQQLIGEVTTETAIR